MQTYDFTTSDDGGRRGGTKYRVNGKDVVFRQDFEKGFGPGTCDIMIWNGDGRWAKMKFVSCRCNLLCHWPGETSDAQVKITAGATPSSEFKYIIEFAPIAVAGVAAANGIGVSLYTTLDDQGRKGGTKFKAIGKDVRFTQVLRPGSGDITISDGDGRYAIMKFVFCKCTRLCHQLGGTSDDRVTVAHDITSDVPYTIQFQPLCTVVAAAATAGMDEK